MLLERDLRIFSEFKEEIISLKQRVLTLDLFKNLKMRSISFYFTSRLKKVELAPPEVLAVIVNAVIVKAAFVVPLILHV